MDGEIDFILDGTSDYYLRVTRPEDLILFKDTSWNCSTGTALSTAFGSYTIDMDTATTYVDDSNIQVQFYQFTTGNDGVDATFTMANDNDSSTNIIEIYDQCIVNNATLQSDVSSLYPSFTLEEEFDGNGFPMDNSDDFYFDSGSTYYIKFIREIDDYDRSYSGSSFSYNIAQPCENNTPIALDFTSLGQDQLVASDVDKLYKVNVPAGTADGVYNLSAMVSNMSNGDSIYFYIYSCPETANNYDHEFYIDAATLADEPRLYLHSW